MATVLQTAAIGQNFDGTVNRGEVLLSTVSLDDTQRAEIFSIAVQSSDIQTSIVFKLASSLANANGAGPFIELANLANVTGMSSACCRCIVPRGWTLYVFTAGPVVAAKYLIVDWQRVTLEGRA